jgi:hypothetical protein
MIIKYTITRTAKASIDVCLWNTWDHEHLYFVHRQFDGAKILFENQTSALISTKFKIPFIPFSLTGLHALFSITPHEVLVIDTLPFGILTKLTMSFSEITSKETKISNYYELDIPFIIYIFKPLLLRLIDRWNKVNWDEDLPLKTRRQIAVDLGFVDFMGIVSSNKNRKNRGLKLPIPRLKDSILNE